MNDYYTFKKLFDYISIHVCPHDMVCGDKYRRALEWTNKNCRGIGNCEECWKQFITEVME